MRRFRNKSWYSAFLLVCLCASGRSPALEQKQLKKSTKKAAVAAKPAPVSPRPHAGNHLERPLPHDEPAEATEYFLMRRLPPGEKRLPVERYFSAASQAQRMDRHSTARESALLGQAAAEESFQAGLETWTPLGPTNVAGRTRALLVDPIDPNIMFAGGVGGGVWKSTDGGVSWLPISDLLANIAVTALAMDPTDHNVIYAGTGEGYYNYDAIPGGGVFKSTDGGLSWVQLPRPTGFSFDAIFKVVVSPHNSNLVYIASRSGLHSLTNDQQFGLLLYAPEGGCSDLVVRPDKPTDHLFVSCGLFGPATVYRNKDAANQAGNYAWESVLSFQDMGRTSLALAPSNPDVIYAMGMQINQNSNLNYAVKGIFRSLQGGDKGSWTTQFNQEIPDPLGKLLLTNPLAATASACAQGGDLLLHQGWYDSVLAVDPVDPNRVWAGGIDLFRSDDGGVTWGLASYWWAKENQAYVHADQHAIVFHPQYNGSSNRTMFVTNDGGIFRTNDTSAATAKGPLATCAGSNSALSWAPINGGYAVTQFYQGAPYPGGQEYLGGTQDNGTLKGNASSTSWTETLGGDGGYVAVNPLSTNILYASTPGLNLRRSMDGGQTWQRITGTFTDVGLFVTPFLMLPSTPNVLFTGGIWVWRTVDGGDTWTQATEETPGNGLVSAIAVAPSDSNVMAVGLSDGWLAVYSQAVTGVRVSGVYRAPRYGFVSSLAFDPTASNIIYATYSSFNSGAGRHIYKSIDGGQNWLLWEGVSPDSIPDTPVNSLVIHPQDRARLYAGTDSGVFVSLDGGLHWSLENTGFANASTESLKIEPTGEYLFAFTHGRGAWKVRLRPQGLRVEPSILDFGLQFQGAVSTPRAVTVTNVTNNPIAISGVSTSGVFAASHDCSTLAGGASCSIQVTVTPPLGATSGDLTITYGGPGGTFSVPLRAQGYTGPALTVAPTAVDFGPVVIGSTSQPISIQLSNTGSAPLSLNGIQTTAPSFAVQNRCPDVLAIATNCLVNVRYTPSGTVNETASIRIDSNTATSPDSVALKGTSQSLPGFTVTVQSIAAGTPNAKVNLFASKTISPQTIARLDGQDRPTTTSPFFRMSLTDADVLKPGIHQVTLFDPQSTPQVSSPGLLVVFMPFDWERSVYDPFRRVHYVLPRYVSDNPFGPPPPPEEQLRRNSVSVLDVANNRIVGRIPVPRPVDVELSGDGRYLYILGYDTVISKSLLYRFDVAAQVMDRRWVLTFPISFDTVRSLTAIPNDNKALLIESTYLRLQLFRDGLFAPRSVSFYGRAFVRFDFKDAFERLRDRMTGSTASPYPLLAFKGDDGSTIYKMEVAEDGVSALGSTSFQAGGGPIRSSGGRVYLNNGVTIDPETMQRVNRYSPFLSQWAGYSNVGAPFPDAERKLVTFLSGPVRVFDRDSADLISEINPPPNLSPLYKTDPDTVLAGQFLSAEYSGLVEWKDSRLNPHAAPSGPASMSGLSPGATYAGGDNFFLSVSGSGFTEGSTVMWNGQAKTTHFLNPNVLIAYIPSEDIGDPGARSVSVETPGAGTTTAFTFTIEPPALSISPKGLNFGSVVNGRSSSLSLQVTNQSSTAVAVASPLISPSAFSATTGCPTQLPAGGTCYLTIWFSPSASGEYFGEVSVQIGNSASPASFPLNGTGFDLTLQTSRPKRPSRNIAAGNLLELEVVIHTDLKVPQVVSLSCSSLHRDYKCKTLPNTVLLGTASSTVRLLLEGRRAARLRIGSSPVVQVNLFVGGTLQTIVVK